MENENLNLNETPADAKPVLGVVFLLIETDDSHGNKGVYGIFDTKEKADAELKKWCGNDKWCSFTIQEWSVK